MSVQQTSGVILVQKKISWTFSLGVKGTALVPLVGPGQSSGGGHREQSPQKLLGFRHLRWL